MSNLGKRPKSQKRRDDTDESFQDDAYSIVRGRVVRRSMIHLTPRRLCTLALPLLEGPPLATAAEASSVGTAELRSLYLPAVGYAGCDPLLAFETYIVVALNDCRLCAYLVHDLSAEEGYQKDAELGDNGYTIERNVCHKNLVHGDCGREPRNDDELCVGAAAFEDDTAGEGKAQMKTSDYYNSSWTPATLIQPIGISDPLDGDSCSVIVSICCSPDRSSHDIACPADAKLHSDGDHYFGDIVALTSDGVVFIVSVHSPFASSEDISHDKVISVNLFEPLFSVRATFYTGECGATCLCVKYCEGVASLQKSNTISYQLCVGHDSGIITCHGVECIPTAATLVKQPDLALNINLLWIGSFDRPVGSLSSIGPIPPTSLVEDFNVWDYLAVGLSEYSGGPSAQSVNERESVVRGKIEMVDVRMVENDWSKCTNSSAAENNRVCLSGCCIWPAPGMEIVDDAWRWYSNNTGEKLRNIRDVNCDESFLAAPKLIPLRGPFPGFVGLYPRGLLVMVHARRSPSDHRYLEWGIKHDANQIQFARGGIAAGVVDENIPLVACCLAGGSVYAFRGENTNEEFTVKKQTTPVELHRNYASWSNEDGGGECSIDGFCAGSCLTFCENYEDNMTARGSCNKTKNRRHKPIPLLVVAATGGALDVFACATKFGRKEDDSKNIFHKLLLDGTVHQLFVLLQSGRSGSAKWNLAAKVCEGLDGHDVASQILSNNQLQPIRDLILDIANGGANS